MTTKSKNAPEADAAPSPPEAEGEESAPAQPRPSEQPSSGTEPAPGPSAEPSAAPPEGVEPATELERELAVYPVREGADDPGWAVNIVWGWTWFTLACFAFILAMLLLGYLHD